MSPNTTLDIPPLGANGWRKVAEEVLARARAVSRHADERVRAALGDTQTTAAITDEPTQEHKPMWCSPGAGPRDGICLSS